MNRLTLLARRGLYFRPGFGGPGALALTLLCCPLSALAQDTAEDSSSEAASESEPEAPGSSEAGPSEAEAAEAAAQQAAEEAARAAAEQAAREAAEQAAATAPEPEAEPRASSAVEATGLDARVRRVSDEIATAIKRLPGDHRLERFAVMPFEQVGPEVKSRQLGVVVADLVLTNLARDHRIPVTERSQLNKVLQEKSIAEMGLTQETEAVDVGQIMQARALVVGQIADVGNDFKLQIRVLDVSTARVAHAAEVNLPKEELIALSTDAVVLKSRADAMFRSAVAPGWGQVYNGEPVKAGLVGGGVVGLAGLTVLTGLSAATAYVLYSTADKDTNNFYGVLFLNFDKATKQAQDQQLATLYAISNVAVYATAGMLAITALAWGIGVADAYASGVDVDSLDEALVRQ